MAVTVGRNVASNLYGNTYEFQVIKVILQKRNDIQNTTGCHTAKLRTPEPPSVTYLKLIITKNKYLILPIHIEGSGDCGSTVIKVLCYKLEGRWFDPSWYQWIFR